MNALYQDVPWEAGVWTNQSAEVKIEYGRLNVTAETDTDKGQHEDPPVL